MKNILVVATGGTIASTPQEHAGGALAPGLTGQEIADYVPQATGICNLDVVQPLNIDSTNMCPADWTTIAHTITSAYDRYDGFVVLHGTDTMAYTAAALSYLIQDSRKPIVLTGSQQPMAHPFTDAKLNLYQSLLYASDDASHNVSVVFDGSVIVGTRAHKQRTMSYNAFTSVNYPLPAVIRGENIVRNGGADMSLANSSPNAAPRSPHLYRKLDEHVMVLRLTPGLDPHIFRLLARNYHAIILETFGIGGIPQTDAANYQQAIFDWVDSGHTLVITTQVPEEGLNLGVYEVGRTYAEHPGILRGDDMTTEALVAKTMWALGQTQDPAVVAKLFYQPINHDRVPPHQ